jgi:hypothetical protein
VNDQTTDDMNEQPAQQPQRDRLPALVAAGGKARAIIPQTLEDTWRIATAVIRAGFAPKGLETVDKCVLAIMHGAEVGLPPMMSLQSIAVINGRPSLYGDGALAVVRNSGQLETIRESFREADMTAVCVIKRRGEPAVTRRFSQADAEVAKLWGKKTRSGEPTPWVTFPKRMLAMRARSWAMRDAFADHLKGLGIAEEVGDVIEHQATPQTALSGPPGLEDEPEGYTE